MMFQKKRGDLFVWIDEDVIANWASCNRKITNRNLSRQQKFCDLIIRTCLTIRQPLKFPLRQTGAFMSRLFRKMNISLQVPNYTTLSRRVGASKMYRKATSQEESITLLIDSRSLKIVGGGE